MIVSFILYYIFQRFDSFSGADSSTKESYKLEAIGPLHITITEAIGTFQSIAPLAICAHDHPVWGIL